MSSVCCRLPLVMPSAPGASLGEAVRTAFSTADGIIRAFDWKAGIGILQYPRGLLEMAAGRRTGGVPQLSLLAGEQVLRRTSPIAACRRAMYYASYWTTLPVSRCLAVTRMRPALSDGGCYGGPFGYDDPFCCAPVVRPRSHLPASIVATFAGLLDLCADVLTFLVESSD